MAEATVKSFRELYPGVQAIAEHFFLGVPFGPDDFIPANLDYSSDDAQAVEFSHHFTHANGETYEILCQQQDNGLWSVSVYYQAGDDVEQVGEALYDYPSHEAAVMAGVGCVMEVASDAWIGGE